MSAAFVLVQIACTGVLASLALALVVGAVLALDGRIDARDVLDVGLGVDLSAGPTGSHAGSSTRAAPVPRGTGSGVLDLRDWLAPPPG